MNSKRFLFFLGVGVLLLCSLTLAINIYVNPYGYYGDKSLGGAYIFNAQEAKLLYLKKNSDKPNAYVLGSSNSMRMVPETIDSLFGVHSFNYGVYQATVEDFYCIAHALIDDLKAKPKLFIICIDDWNFKNYTHPKDEVFVGAQNRLAYKTQLSQYLPNYSFIRLIWSQFKSGISYEQLKLSLTSLYEAYKSKDYKRQELDLSGSFYQNGVRLKYADEEGKDITEIAERGVYNLTAYLTKKHQEALKKNKKGIFAGSHEDFKNLEPERVELFKELITYLDKNNVKVILNIMPIQPYYKKLVLQNSQYESRMSKLLSILNSLKRQDRNILLIQNNNDISRFSGYENQFFDHIHPTSVNSKLMLLHIKKDLKGIVIQ